LILVYYTMPIFGQMNLPNTGILGFYSISGNIIYEHDCMTGTVQPVYINGNIGTSLAIGKVFGSSNMTQTFYLRVRGNYHYVDPVTLQLVNTGHQTIGLNFGIGNRYLFNITTNNIYRYDGTSNDVLIKTLTPQDGTGFVADIYADCEDNFYLLNTTHLRKYDANGNFLQSWPHNIPNFTGGGGGIALIGDSLYFHRSGTIYVSAIQGPNVVFSRAYTYSIIVQDMANIMVGPAPIIRVIDSQSCNGLYMIQATLPGSISTPTYTWYLNGSPIPGNNSAILQRNFLVGDVVRLKVEFAGSCISEAFSNYLPINTSYGNIYTTVDTAICHGTSYAGYSQSGTYIDTFATANCDSIRRLELTVRPMPVVMETITHCNPVLPVTWNGQTVSQAGTFTLVDTSTQVQTGCDSVTVLTLNIFFSDTTHFYDTTCYLKDGYRWHNNRYFAPGTYYHTLTAGNGCDSILVLHLSMDAAPTADTTRLANCLSVTFNGQEYRKDTAIVQTYRNINQCDSHYTVTQITIHRAYTINYEKTVCRGEAFTVNGIEYRQEGTYIQPYTSMAGCDSNIRITLRISEFPEYALTVTPEQPPYCLGDRVTVAAPEDYVYNWMGYPVDSAGNAIQVFRLDSVYNTFPFTVKNTFNCEVADTLRFEAEKCCRITFPTAFSPNDDGLNDDFGPMPLSAVNDYYNLSIFNRWGQKVFTSTHINNRWNGHIKGENAATDVYYYYLEYTCYDGKKYVLKGNVTLLK